MRKLTIDETQSKQRLDAYCLKLIDISRSIVQKLIDNGSIRVNNEQKKNGYKLKAGDIIDIDFDKQELEQVPVIDLPVLYEDNDCVVIDKPAGILTHSKGTFNPEATVATFIANKVTGLDGERAGIVHRLDRATSGVMICAKNLEAQSWLQKQFAQRKTKKTYYAVIQGKLDPPEAVIDMPIERNPKAPKQFRVGSGGKTAQTAYKTLSSSGEYTLLELKPVTGRTHQIRVHLKQLNHPIVGDELYGGKQAHRLMLHAASLELTLPSRERRVFESATPTEFKAIMK